jgi:hypothetical protein
LAGIATQFWMLSLNRVPAGHFHSFTTILFPHWVYDTLHSSSLFSYHPSALVEQSTPKRVVLACRATR